LVNSTVKEFSRLGGRELPASVAQMNLVFQPMGFGFPGLEISTAGEMAIQDIPEDPEV
jgi:hypothetical protein